MNSSLRLLIAFGLALVPGLVQAQPSAHYVPGVEGIKGASLPPPGVYARDYNYIYWSHQLNGPSGHDAGPPNFDAFTYANVPRVIWITDVQVLGGFLGVDALLPLVYKNVTAGPYQDHNFGVGDFFTEGTLSWHPKQFDLAVGAGFWAPTGKSSTPVDAGLGFWTPMLTAGGTWYIDTNKTWAVSALNRYEFNTEQSDTGITPGQAYTLEWGISKTLEKVFDLGVVGYYQLQTTTDKGTGASSNRDMAAAVGPEFSVAFPKIMTFVSVRYLYEFTAVSRAQGQAVVLTLTKRF